MAMNENDRGDAAARDPALDRLYREAGDEGPPAHLDAAILAAAHREVGARPRARPGMLRRWQVPVSIAAVVVLSVSLVTLVREEGGEQFVQPTPSSRPEVQSAAELARSAPAPAEAERPRPSLSAPAPVGAVGSRRDEPAAPAATGSLARDALGEVGPASTQQGAGAMSQPDAAARPPAQPFRDPAAPAERRSVERQAAAAEDAVAPASAPASAGRNAAPAAAPAAKPSSSRLMASEMRKEAAAAADARPPVWQGYENAPPEKWLERIAELRRQERGADAEAMLAEFRRRFPVHPVPAGVGTGSGG
jgi:hypothetical protein